MTAEEFIYSWIENFLSVNNAAFNNLPPCPYAKQAWLFNKVVVIENELPKNYEKLLEKHEVIIYAYNPSDITAEDLYQRSLEITNDNIVALDDHPDNIEQVQDVILNAGKYALLLIQERNKLEHARKILKSKDYYKNWDPKYLEEVLGQ